MAGRPTWIESGMVSKRRADAIELRLAGVDNVTIGRKLSADPNQNSDGVAYPYGYGRERYDRGDDPHDDGALARLVSDDLNDVLRDRANRINEGYEQLKAVQEARIERMFIPVYQKALKGDLGAVDRAVRLMERQARLHGLDAPTRTELAGPDQGAIELAAVDSRRILAMEHLAMLRIASIDVHQLTEGGEPAEDDPIAEVDAAPEAAEHLDGPVGWPS